MTTWIVVLAYLGYVAALYVIARWVRRYVEQREERRWTQ